MNRLLTQNLWPAISKLAKNSLKRAAIAYVSSDEHIQFGEGDLLVCDASTNAIRSGQTSASVLKRAFERNATVYSLPGLHAKVVLLNEKALIGSANASDSSARNLIEAALLTDQPSIVTMAQSLVNQLASQATILTEKKIDRLLSIKVERRTPTNRTKGNIKTRIGNHKNWIIRTTEILTDISREQEAVEASVERLQDKLGNPRSSVSWVRWIGRSRFRREVGEGDWMIQMWSPHGRKLPTDIYERMPILDREEIDKATYIYYEEFPKSNDRTKSFGDFKKLAQRAGIRRQIKPESQFEITEHQADLLQELWSEK